ncbi:hypothetical protein PSTT_08116 [Puccinia striiformis]|uniref:Uncharacterized protein n=1 Tax=Puccinia striiformis TaxID=27350 RepID=A0A2S4VDR3_9BASI|nr:hypothetical protein PSTT_08116 [Puccinia striiformis]
MQGRALTASTNSNRPTFEVKRLRDVRFAFAADSPNVNRNGGVRSTFWVKRHPTSPHVTQTFAGGRRPFAAVYNGRADSRAQTTSNDTATAPPDDMRARQRRLRDRSTVGVVRRHPGAKRHQGAL